MSENTPPRPPVAPGGPPPLPLPEPPTWPSARQDLDRAEHAQAE